MLSVDNVGAARQNNWNKIPITKDAPLFKNIEHTITNKILIIKVKIVDDELIIIYCKSSSLLEKNNPEAYGCLITYT